jgi:alpha-amylase
LVKSIHERQYVRGGRLVIPFGVAENWSSDGEIDSWLDEINHASDNPISAFDFPLRYRLKDLCDSYGFSLRRLAEGGTVMAERPDRAVTFVDNHDFRGGDSSPIVNDKLMAYAFILTHPGYPCVFWQDYFEQGLGRAGGPNGIAALVTAHERNAGGDALVRYVDDDLYIMERTGWQSATGLVFVLNNRGDRWSGSYIDTSRTNTAYRPVAWSGQDGAAPQPTGTAVLRAAPRLRRVRARLTTHAISTAAPATSPRESRASATLASRSGCVSNDVFTGICPASARNSRASARVKLATLASRRSHQSSS